MTWAGKLSAQAPTKTLPGHCWPGCHGNSLYEPRDASALGWDGATPDWDELKKSYPEHTFAGLYRGGRQWHIQLPPQRATYLQTVRNQTLLGTSQVAATPGQAIILSTGRPQTLLRTDPLANIVYFPPEGRNVTEPQKSRSELLDMIPFNWVARFDHKVNLDSVLLTVKTRDPERFEECLKFVNLALRHRVKRITGFGENGRLVVEGSERIRPVLPARD